MIIFFKSNVLLWQGHLQLCLFSKDIDLICHISFSHPFVGKLFFYYKRAVAAMRSSDLLFFLFFFKQRLQQWDMTVIILVTNFDINLDHACSLWKISLLSKDIIYSHPYFYGAVTVFPGVLAAIHSVKGTVFILYTNCTLLLN